MNARIGKLQLYAITLIFLLVVLLTTTELSNSSNINLVELEQEELNPVLFLHGWSGITWVWNSMIDYFKADGWPTNLLYANPFENSSNCSVNANIRNSFQISSWVEDIIVQLGAAKVDLVAHGMGGLSARYYIKYLGGIDKVDDFVSIVSPHHGNNDTTCGADGVNDFVLLLNDGDETPGGLLSDTLGIRQDPIFPNRIYNGSHVPGVINYTSIYVLPHDAQIDGRSSPLDGCYNIKSEFYSHSQIIREETTYQLVLSALGKPFQFINSSNSGQETQEEWLGLDINKRIFIGSSLFMITVVYASTMGRTQMKTWSKRRQIKRTKQILSGLADVLSPKQLSYLALLGQSDSPQGEWEEEVQVKLKTGLLPYRYLMHPVRLSIMKSLYQNFTMSSREIKNQLDLSWSDYSNHLNSLNKKGYVSVQTEFHGSDQIQVVYLEERGRQEYKALVDLLNDFLNGDQ